MSERKVLLGKRLKAARSTAKLSQEFAAEALGVTRQSVSAWERGASSPSAVQLGELAAMYCVCAHSLLFGGQFIALRIDQLIPGRKLSLSQPQGKVL